MTIKDAIGQSLYYNNESLKKDLISWNGWDDFKAYNLDASAALPSGSTAKGCHKVHRDDKWCNEIYCLYHQLPPLGFKGVAGWLA